MGSILYVYVFSRHFYFSKKSRLLSLRFLRSQRIIYFYRYFFSGLLFQSMQLHSKTCTGKYSKTPKVPAAIFLRESRYFSTEYHIPLHMHIFFSIPETPSLQTFSVHKHSKLGDAEDFFLKFLRKS